MECEGVYSHASGLLLNTFQGKKQTMWFGVIHDGMGGSLSGGLTCYSAATLFNATNTVELKLFLILNSCFFFTRIITWKENIKIQCKY